MLTPSIFRSNFMDDFFEDMFPATGSFGRPLHSVMKTDVKEEEDHYRLEVEVPGIAKEDIQAELKDGYLIITAQQNHSNDSKDEEGKYIRRERYTGKSQRSFFVGDHVKQEDIHAAFKDGILEITVPKTAPKETVEARKLIDIK